jgi:hypothetical protein
MPTRAEPQMPPGLTPLEQALIETIRRGHDGMISEFRALRWSTTALIVLLIGGVFLLKGLDPKEAAAIVPTVTASAGQVP